MGDPELFGAGVGATVDVFVFSIRPSFTVLASSVPFGFSQTDPLASSFSVMSCMLAAFPPLVTVVFSVTLKTRDFALLAIVNVFPF